MLGIIIAPRILLELDGWGVNMISKTNEDIIVSTIDDAMGELGRFLPTNINNDKRWTFTHNQI